MLLRNKNTGEIGEFNYIPNEKYPLIVHTKEPADAEMYDSLARLNEDWEDYEEAEYYYAITSIKSDDGITKMKNRHNDMNAFDKAIGNYFASREEAQKVVEKLKAFKRLQDLGFKFEGIRFRNNHNYIEWKLEPKNELTDHETGELLEGLYKVFGGNDDN